MSTYSKRPIEVDLSIARIGATVMLTVDRQTAQTVAVKRRHESIPAQRAARLRWAGPVRPVESVIR